MSVGEEKRRISIPREPQSKLIGDLDLLVEAFENKSTQQLDRALANNPALLAANLSFIRNKRASVLSLAHLAVEVSWLGALDVLAKRGETFVGREVNSGLTPLGFAMYALNTSAANRLLKLGVSVHDEHSSMPALGLLPSISPSTPQPADSQYAWPAKALRLAEGLLAGGADPWRLIPFQNKDRSAVEICLFWNRHKMAALLLNHAAPPQEFFESRTSTASLHEAWIKSLKTGTLKDHCQLFDALSHRRLLPDIGTLIGHLAQASSTGAVYGSRSETEQEVAASLVERYLNQEPNSMLTPEHLEAASSLGLKRLHARMVEYMLENGTNLVSPSTSRALRL